MSMISLLTKLGVSGALITASYGSIEDMVDGVLDQGILNDEESKTGLEEIVNALIVRKRAYFSEYTRAIVSYDLTETKDGYNLAVASTLEEQAQQ